ERLVRENEELRRRIAEVEQQVGRGSDDRYRAVFEEAAEGILIMSLDGAAWSMNQAFARMHGYSDPEEMRHLRLGDLDAPATARLASERLERLRAGESLAFEVEHYHKDGHTFFLDVCCRVIDLGGKPHYVGFHQDVTPRKRAEAERIELHARLRQAEKMEAVGRLAGGVAHDFNNMLGVILGNADLALAQVEPATPLAADLREIRRAAERSAELTRQLLSFARKQTIIPAVLDPNEVVGGVLTMLRRLVGENIDLVWVPGAAIGSVYMDPTQVHRILVNLCVNARDAIADAGRITVETASRHLDAAACAGRADAVVGEYVVLSVRDDGCGMDRTTVDRMFEPFFTTKELGRGTGLGLSTVDGIVRQNGGHITVDSAPGRGTTVRVHLPVHAPGVATTTTAATATARRGGETILLVEDEPSLLRLTARMLEELGYRVLPAALPGEAMLLVRRHPGPIHLLLTDVVMPEMNGRDLARNLRAFFPDLRCLFMSGYATNVIAPEGVLAEGTRLLQKPFAREELAAAVRRALDEPLEDVGPG
ncbi:MAG: response regulator, partial [Deltaproteobacteria bacterium]|nr:response regulator [Deltaproteobacteria bacterium]